MTSPRVQRSTMPFASTRSCAGPLAAALAWTSVTALPDVASAFVAPPPEAAQAEEAGSTASPTEPPPSGGSEASETATPTSAESPEPSRAAPPEDDGTPPPAEAIASPEPAEPADPPSPTEESDPLDALAKGQEPVIPDRLPPLQVAGWWTVLSAVVLGTTAGVLTGFAQRESDRALRLATRFDSETNAQLVYADVQDEYEEILVRGRRLDAATIAFGVLAGATAVAAITLFVVDAHRRHRKGSRSRAHIRGLEFRF